MAEGDLVADLGSVRRSSLVDSRGRTYLEVRRALSPRYRIVWLQLALGWLVVVAIATALVVADGHLVTPVAGKVAMAIAGSIAIGFWLHFLLQFQHEGTHYNLARTRKANDRLANAVIGIFVGEDVRNYRTIHLDHHRYLGTPQDTERSYFDPLDGRFILQGLLGLRLLRILAARRQKVDTKDTGSGSGPSSYFTAMFPLALAFNGTIVIVAAVTGHWVLSVSWVAGSLVFLPFINATRQVLEHRSETADPSADYTKVAHGAVNRLFGDGPLASTLGPAGFNRHLLHHWDPGVSYTRLRELEEYLLDTEMAPLLRKRTTTYAATTRRLAFR
jgi:fatty acid desaturase